MRGLLEVLWTRARGIFGMGAVTGAIGYVVGVVWGFFSMVSWPLLLRDPEAWTFLAGNARLIVTSALWYGVTWAIPAGLIGSAFAGALAIGQSDQRLDELRLWKMAAMGAAVGAAVPILSTLQLGGLTLLLDTLGIVAGDAAGLAVVGAAVSSGLVIAAKRADRAELAIVEEVAALAASTHEGPATLR